MNKLLHENILRLKNISLILLLFVSAGFVSCKKSDVQSYSKFKIQPLNYIGSYYINTIKLDNGNYVTVDQDASYLHINIGLYDKNSNLLSLKQYPFTSSRDISSGLAVGGGFLVAGFSSDYKQYFVTRFDAKADVLWDSSYTSPYVNSNLYSIICCNSKDGNILLSGSYMAPDNEDSSLPPFIAKINAGTGALLFPPIDITGVDVSYYNCNVNGIYERNDGIYISGYYFYMSGHPYDWTFGTLFCLKTQENGITSWINYDPPPPANRYLVGNPFTTSYNIAETNSGPVVLIATNTQLFAVQSAQQFINYWYILFGNTVARSYDPITGNKIDAVAFNINNKTGYPIIHPTKDGGYIIGTTGNIFLNSFTAPTLVLLIKTDAQFKIQWQQTYDPAGSNFTVFGVFARDDGYELIGQSNGIVNSKPTMGTFFMKTDLQGNLKD